MMVIKTIYVKSSLLRIINLYSFIISNFERQKNFFKAFLNIASKKRNGVLFLFLFLLLAVTNSSAANYYIDSKSFEVTNSIITSTLDVEDEVAELSVKVRHAIIVKKPGKHYYSIAFNPSFIDGKGVYSSTLIDYEIVRVARNGQEELYNVITTRNGKKFIEIYSKGGAEITQGNHIYEVWYKARNKVVLDAKVQSFYCQIGEGFPVKNLDLAVYLGPNLTINNTKVEPLDESLIVRSDNSYIRIYNNKEIVPIKSTLFTINFTEEKKEKPILDLSQSKQVNGRETSNAFVLFFSRNLHRFEFILALFAAISSVATLVWYLNQLRKSP